MYPLGLEFQTVVSWHVGTESLLKASCALTPPSQTPSTPGSHKKPWLQGTQFQTTQVG